MEPLPRGRHGLSREFIAEHQRERLLAAIAELLDEQGYDGTTVSAIAGRPGVSKSDFYRHFGSKDECFFAAYDEAVERLRAASSRCSAVGSLPVNPPASTDSSRNLPSLR